MPITIADAPGTLSGGAAKIYVGAFNGAYSGSCKDEGDRRDECAARIAWSAVKKKYKKSGDKWVKKSAAEAEFNSPFVPLDFVVVKASSSGGEMRWVARASDTMKDDWDTRMTQLLFQNFIKRSGEADHLPYLSIAHYGALGGAGIAGDTVAMWIDGNAFKVKGTFRNNSAGRALYGTVKREMADPTIESDNRVRMSIAFADLAHNHGDQEFIRRSLDELCARCEAGQLPDEYTDGHLIHIAATRIPVNRRTEIEVGGPIEARSSKARTRRDDAASIVGSELADQLERLAREGLEEDSAGKGRSVVVKSEQDLSTSAEPGTPEWIEEARTRFQQHTAQRAITAVDAYVYPYGGATSLADAKSFVDAQKEATKLYDGVDMLMAIAHNIMADPSIEDKLTAMSEVFQSFGGWWKKQPESEEFRSAADQGVTDMAEEVTTQVTTEEEEQEREQEETTEIILEEVQDPTSEPEVALSAAMVPVVAAIQTFQEGVVLALSEAGLEPSARLEKIQPLLNEMGNQLVAAANRPATPGDEVAMALRSALQAELTPLVQSIQALVATMGRGPEEGPPVGRRTYSHVATVRAAEGKPLSQIDELARKTTIGAMGRS